jgi:hypothetical protein
MTTTNFQECLDGAGPETPDEIYYLFQAIKNAGDEGMWYVSKHGNQLFVRDDNCPDTLLLASPSAKQTFLNHIERKFCGEMDMESWYGYQRNLNNPHA